MRASAAAAASLSGSGFVPSSASSTSRRRSGVGATAPAVYNAANEVCVEAFRDGRLRFVDIVPTVAAVLGEHDVRSEAELTVDDVLAADAWARDRASTLI